MFSFKKSSIALSVALAISIGVSLTFSEHSFAGNTTWERSQKFPELTNMASRPTIADIEKSLNPWPAKNPFRAITKAESQISNNIDLDGPRIIASLERAFPGGTYAFLGRDSVFLADIVDAFYRSKGQNNRVVRLNASGGSMNVTQDILVGFLATNGLHVATLNEDPPFVLIDATSWRATSQSRLYVKAFYAEYDKTGKPLKSLVRKFNVIDTKNRPVNLIGKVDVDAFLTDQENTISLDGPADILHLEGATPFAYSDAWHGTFELLQRAPDGRVFAPPGQLTTIEMRLAILEDLYDVMGVVSSEKFYTSVKREAKSLGFVFPEGRIRDRTDIRLMTADEIAEQTFLQGKEKFKELILGLGPVGEASEPFTANGKLIFDLIKLDVYGNEGPKSSTLALMYLAGSVKAFEEGKISDRDLRRLIKRVLAHYPYASEPTDQSNIDSVSILEAKAFKDGLAKLYGGSTTFQNVWNLKQAYFLDKEHKSGPGGSQSYASLDIFLKSNCNRVLQSISK